MLYRVTGIYTARWSCTCGHSDHDTLWCDEVTEAPNEGEAQASVELILDNRIIRARNVYVLDGHWVGEPVITLAPPDECMRRAGVPMFFEVEV